MPYTLSHSIIALPVNKLSRGKLPVAALIVGSLSPDFPYQIALTPVSAPGHSLSGVLIYCLLPSLMVLAMWYRWLETENLALFALRQRREKFGRLSYLMMVLGVLIGAYSHALWDATSHHYGFIAANSTFLRSELFGLPLYKWNQYSSGVLGLLGLFIWYLRAVFKNKKAAYRGHFYLGLCVYLVCITFFVLLSNVRHGSSLLSEYLVRSSIACMSGFFIAAVIYALSAKFLMLKNAMSNLN